ncbi:peptidoglycan editing factor PgeF [Komagataeibacter sp. FNDCF1]|uniref:peptidoglycan editing factor PgeF n=1 Tax=Komagataeibacter sp. FNDCF1 TaxID=2878681 RepID=UPI001E4A5B4D|nr:peptidoglycan editing factor PgeF [Komagataeibacter sp. FNDCF1]MCE2565695.1 peptidoglycan editing factor PgeF [Komagataeibacter sp. FNDCF1]
MTDSAITDAQVVRAPFLAATRHGFFTRQGGVSTGPYASLNCSTRSADAAGAVRENRRRVAHHVGVRPEHLLGLTQVHGDHTITVTTPWAEGAGPEGDGLVTSRPGLALGVITADCAPILFSNARGTVVGAAHAGWRGACGGIMESVVAAMGALGCAAGDISAVVGPCIAPRSYEVGPDMRDAVLACDASATDFFVPAARQGHFMFDLPGYCVARLERCGVGRAMAVGLDTLHDEARFFSHRRRTLAGGGPIGHQISVIACRGL